MHGGIAKRTMDDAPSSGTGFWLKAFAIAGVGGLGVAGVLANMNGGEGVRRFLFAYLTSYAFVLSIALGALFFVILQHLTRAGWGVSVRRIAELLTGSLPLLAVLALPIVILGIRGDGQLYEWMDSAKVHADHLLHGKAPYLNVPFFLVRLAVYFGLWIMMARFFTGRSVQQDKSGDPRLTLSMERASPVSMIAFSLTITFAAFDLLMSLAPRWFSTIFGVYYFGGSVLSFVAVICLVLMMLQRQGRMQHVTTEHYHDLGKLLFGFVFFWGYVAFSQYMLIWYANIPEETEWFLHRQGGDWLWVSLILLFGHFIIPFLGLMSRHVKRHKPALAFWCVYLLVMHWVDMYWLVVPQMDAHHAPFGLTEIAAFVGLAGLFGAAVVWQARGKLLAPAKDPRAPESLAFENM